MIRADHCCRYYRQIPGVDDTGVDINVEAEGDIRYRRGSEVAARTMHGAGVEIRIESSKQERELI